MIRYLYRGSPEINTQNMESFKPTSLKGLPFNGLKEKDFEFYEEAIKKLESQGKVNMQIVPRQILEDPRFTEQLKKLNSKLK